MECKCVWPQTPAKTDLDELDVHVWCALLAQPDFVISRLAQTLSQDEHERASRFVFARDRQHFIVARGVLRQILGNYLAVDPTQIRLKYGPNGKPTLTESRQLGFNLSHSHGLAIYAVSRLDNIGVDVELLRPLEAMDSLAQRFFSKAEYQAFSSLSAADRLAGFFSGWTRKEAYIKAVGSGLSHPLHQFDVSLIPNRPAELLRVQGDLEAPKRWSFFSFSPAPNYLGALCVKGRNCQVSYGQFSLAR